MKVMIITDGTRGDVQPFAALAHGLEAAGHTAILCAPSSAAFLVEPYGVTFVPLHDAWDDLMRDDDVRAAFETNFRGLAGPRRAVRVMRLYRSQVHQVLDGLVSATDLQPDLVVHHVGLPGHELAEWLGVPAVPVCIEPTSIPTAVFANPMFPYTVARPLNRASYWATRLWVRGTVGSTTRWRTRTLGLPRRSGHQDVTRRPNGTRPAFLQAFSQHLLPAAPDYPDWVHTTGFWFLPRSPQWTPPSPLLEFLATGAPPVYLGFGSLVGTDPHHTGRIVTEAIQIAGVRAVVGLGWGGIRAPADTRTVHRLDQAPFDWLFGRMAAIVHHGGLGTTAAALASGRPQVVCPFMTGNHFYGSRMHEIGVAPPALPQRALTSESLAAAIIEAVGDNAFADRAAEFGRLIRAEDGVSTAVGILESVVAHAHQ